MQPVDALAEQLLLLPAAEFQVVNEKALQCTAAHGFVCICGSIGMLLPALNAAGEFHHRAIAQGDDGHCWCSARCSHGGGHMCMTRWHGEWRNWRSFSAFSWLRREMERGYGGGVQHHRPAAWATIWSWWLQTIGERC